MKDFNCATQALTSTQCWSLDVTVPKPDTGVIIQCLNLWTFLLSIGNHLINWRDSLSNLNSLEMKTVSAGLSRQCDEEEVTKLESCLCNSALCQDLFILHWTTLLKSVNLSSQTPKALQTTAGQSPRCTTQAVYSHLEQKQQELVELWA